MGGEIVLKGTFKSQKGALGKSKCDSRNQASGEELEAQAEAMSQKGKQKTVIIRRPREAETRRENQGKSETSPEEPIFKWGHFGKRAQMKEKKHPSDWTTNSWPEDTGF